MLIGNRVMRNKHITSEMSKSRQRTEKNEGPQKSRVNFKWDRTYICPSVASSWPTDYVSATPGAFLQHCLVNYKRSIHKTYTVSNLNINFKIFKSPNINIPYVSSSMHLLSTALSLLACQTLHSDTTIKQWDVKCLSIFNLVILIWS